MKTILTLNYVKLHDMECIFLSSGLTTIVLIETKLKHYNS